MTTQEGQSSVGWYCSFLLRANFLHTRVRLLSLCWLALESCFLCYLENVQKRALSIIWPGISYETALDKAALSTLSDRQAVSCIKFIGKVRPGNPLYPLMHNRRTPHTSFLNTYQCFKGLWPSTDSKWQTKTRMVNGHLHFKWFWNQNLSAFELWKSH